MNWTDVTTPPRPAVLRQFAGLCLVVFGGLAAWRVADVGLDGPAIGLATAAAAIGLTGLVWPRTVRWIFTGWLIAVFPIGWVVSRVVLAILYYAVFTPLALVFRMMGRDALHLRRPGTGSAWAPKPRPRSVDEYLRQS
jgi:hypothetical protein